MPLKKPIPDSVMRLWRRIRRFELTRTLRATEKRMEYVKKSLAYRDRVEGEEIVITLPDIYYDFDSPIAEPDQQLCNHYGIEFADVKSIKKINS